jgi:hypothetical protein
MAERSALSFPEADAAFPEADAAFPEADAAFPEADAAFPEADAASPEPDAARDEAVPAGWSRASRWAGMLAGDVTSAIVPWANVKPVIVPQVLRLTSAVVCCHVGFVLTSPGAAGP